MKGRHGSHTAGLVKYYVLNNKNIPFIILFKLLKILKLFTIFRLYIYIYEVVIFIFSKYIDLVKKL